MTGAEAARSFTFTLWTDDPALAARADAARVDRIGVDLETLGKRARQAGLGTWISPHRPEALPAVGAALRRAALFARVNPVNRESRVEVERLLGLGAKVLMLPMFETAAEVERFVRLVDGRAHVVLLLETVSGLRELASILALEGVAEVHVGINDMALALRLPNRFSVVVSEEMTDAAAACHAAGVRFGFGGLGRVQDEGLPISPDLLYAQYARLGGTAALVSRAFLAPDPERVDLCAEVAASKERLAYWFSRPRAELDAARDELRRAAAASESW